MNGFVDLTDIVLTWQGLLRDQDPFVLSAEQTQAWKWSWYRSSPALSHSVNALLHTSHPAKSSICYRERESLHIAAALFLSAVFIAGSCPQLFVAQRSYSKQRIVQIWDISSINRVDICVHAIPGQWDGWAPWSRHSSWAMLASPSTHESTKHPKSQKSTPPQKKDM